MPRPGPSDPAGPHERVSVIVPAHDSADTIERTLRSVLGQTWRDLEVVVVDDASGDRTVALVEALMQGDARIRLERHPTNRGAAAARNTGIAAAHGPWLLYLDADDWIDPGHVEGLLKAATRAGSSTAVSGWRFADAEGREDPPTPGKPMPELFALCGLRCPFPIHSCLHRRNDVLAVGGFDEALEFAEDWDLWQRLARMGIEPAVLTDASAVYLQRPGSATRRTQRALIQSLEVLGRTYRVDPRVPHPDPAHADGLPPGSMADALVPFLVWMLGQHAGVGLPVGPVLERLDVERFLRFDVLSVARMMAGGLLQGGGTLRAAAPSRWHELRPRLEAALADLARHVGEPWLAEAVLESMCCDIADAIIGRVDEVVLAPVMAVRIRMDHALGDLTVPEGIHRARVYVAFGSERGKPVDLPAAPPVLAASTIAEAVLAARGARLVRRVVVKDKRSPALLKLAKAALRGKGRRFMLGLLGVPADQRRARLLAWGVANAPRVVPMLKALEKRKGRADAATAQAEPERWQGLFSREDPWGYTSDYEQTKYRHTLEVLGDAPVGRALELACAEGLFTVMLAPRVGRLTAVDIAPKAVERARARCAGLSNVELATLNLRTDPLPGQYDLIVCSEVLYYLSGEAELRRVLRRIADHLEPGGLFLTTHAALVVDDPDATGFGWGRPFGIRRIAAVAASMPGLEFVRELRTPLYRACLFRRSGDRRLGPPRPREVIERDASWPRDPAVLGAIVHGGAVVTRREAERSLLTRRLPILMYHRIAADGPPALARWRVSPERFEAQLAYLKRHGYRGVTLSSWQSALARDGDALVGRTVALTFDDAYVDFAETAWPLLRRYGFPATLFVVSGKTGGRADWDAQHGIPAPLLDWGALRDLARDGVVMGAHSASHAPLTRFGSRGLEAEISGSKATIEDRLGQPVTTFAYPFGIVDELVRNAAAAAGYEAAVTIEPALSTFGDDRMALPRIEVNDEGLDTFAAKLGPPERASLPERLRRRRAEARVPVS